MIDGGDFAPADDVEFDPIPLKLRWRDRSGAETTYGEETFYTKPRIPQGVLFAAEAMDPRGIRGLLRDALRDDDRTTDENGAEVEGTSSRERFDELIFSEAREIPGKALTKILQELYVEYSRRRSNPGAPTRPTTPSAPSSAPPFQTGTTSTAPPYEPVSTSAVSPPTGG